MMRGAPPSERTIVRRLAKRGVYDRETICSILDAAFICHVGFSVAGQTIVTPTIHARLGDRVYLHGSPASRTLQALRDGAEACLTVTLVDGLVLARSAFHHSMNYRSVVVFGHASEVVETAEKKRALRALVDHLIPGRWDHIRQPSDEEMRKTLVVSIPIGEASAKIRTGNPLDDEPDYELPIWAGVLPLQTVPQTPVPDACLSFEVAVPDHLQHYQGPAPAGAE